MLDSSFWTCVLGFAVVGVWRDTKAWASWPSRPQSALNAPELAGSGSQAHPASGGLMNLTGYCAGSGVVERARCRFSDV